MPRWSASAYCPSILSTRPLPVLRSYFSSDGSRCVWKSWRREVGTCTDCTVVRLAAPFVPSFPRSMLSPRRKKPTSEEGGSPGSPALDEDEAGMQTAATKIQSLYRGKKTREKRPTATTVFSGVQGVPAAAAEISRGFVISPSLVTNVAASVVKSVKHGAYSTLQNVVAQKLNELYVTKLKLRLTSDKRMPWIMREAIHDLADSIWLNLSEEVIRVFDKLKEGDDGAKQDKKADQKLSASALKPAGACTQPSPPPSPPEKSPRSPDKSPRSSLSPRGAVAAVWRGLGSAASATTTAAGSAASAATAVAGSATAAAGSATSAASAAADATRDATTAAASATAKTAATAGKNAVGTTAKAERYAVSAGKVAARESAALVSKTASLAGSAVGSVQASVTRLAPRIGQARAAKGSDGPSPPWVPPWAAEAHSTPSGPCSSLCAWLARPIKGVARLPITLRRDYMSLRVTVDLFGATALPNVDLVGLSDPYVTLDLGRRKRRSLILPNTLNPTWNERFLFRDRLRDFLVRPLRITVWDEDYTSGDDLLGEVDLDGEELLDLLSQVLSKTGLQHGSAAADSASASAADSFSASKVFELPLKTALDTQGTVRFSVTVSHVRCPSWTELLTLRFIRPLLSLVERVATDVIAILNGFKDIGGRFSALWYSATRATVTVTVERATGLSNADGGLVDALSDPYAVCRLGPFDFRTKTIADTLDPVSARRSDSFRFLPIPSRSTRWVGDAEPPPRLVPRPPRLMPRPRAPSMHTGAHASAVSPDGRIACAAGVGRELRLRGRARVGARRVAAADRNLR